jgi:hypothetical protein
VKSATRQNGRTQKVEEKVSELEIGQRGDNAEPSEGEAKLYSGLTYYLKTINKNQLNTPKFTPKLPLRWS